MMNYRPRVREVLIHSYAPLPRSIVEGRTAIRHRAGPAYPQPNALSYYDVDEDTIYLLDIPSLRHEIGHVFDLTEMTMDDRRRIQRVMKWGRRWYWRNWNPRTHWDEPDMERFADAYAALCHRPYVGKKHERLRTILREIADRNRRAVLVA